eukprot:scaffold134993_cov121-Phaeocystis_antarctica.AAC.1
MAADTVQTDFFALAAHKSETRWNLSFSPRWSGWLSQHPILLLTIQKLERQIPSSRCYTRQQQASRRARARACGGCSGAGRR